MAQWSRPRSNETSSYTQLKLATADDSARSVGRSRPSDRSPWRRSLVGRADERTGDRTERTPSVVRPRTIDFSSTVYNGEPARNPTKSPTQLRQTVQRQDPYTASPLHRQAAVRLQHSARPHVELCTVNKPRSLEPTGT